MLKISHREQGEWLRPNDIENFPKSILLEIDKLWVDHSNGKFGFSIQSEIWNKLQNNPENFFNKVGWDGISLQQLDNYDDVQEGHFPSPKVYVAETIGGLGNIFEGMSRQTWSMIRRINPQVADEIKEIVKASVTPLNSFSSSLIYDKLNSVS